MTETRLAIWEHYGQRVRPTLNQGDDNAQAMEPFGV